MRAVKNLSLSYRCDPRTLPKVKTTWAKAGLSYERSVVKALTKEFGAQVIHNPWYYFEDDNGPGYIALDVLLSYTSSLTVIECKLKYKVDALKKVKELYQPIVNLAENTTTVPLIITKHLTSDAPRPALSFTEAIAQQATLLHWPGKGSIV